MTNEDLMFAAALGLLSFEVVKILTFSALVALLANIIWNLFERRNSGGRFAPEDSRGAPRSNGDR